MTDPRRAQQNLTQVPATKPDRFGPWWQLSCYGMDHVRCVLSRPLPTCPRLARLTVVCGLHCAQDACIIAGDLSPEEVRMQFYLAAGNNTVDALVRFCGRAATLMMWLTCIGLSACESRAATVTARGASPPVPNQPGQDVEIHRALRHAPCARAAASLLTCQCWCACWCACWWCRAICVEPRWQPLPQHLPRHQCRPLAYPPPQAFRWVPPWLCPALRRRSARPL